MRSSPSYKWWVFTAIAIGTFVSVVDNGSVLVALPEIERHFDSDLPTVQWVVVGNALAISALILPMGRLGDIAGRKWVYIGGVALFVVFLGLGRAGGQPPVADCGQGVPGHGFGHGPGQRHGHRHLLLQRRRAGARPWAPT